MPQPCWTRERVVTAIQAFVARTGRWPLSQDCRATHGLPQVLVIVRLFGRLDAARQAAGMPPGALPRRGTAFDAAWAGTWPREAEVTAGGEEP